MSIVEPADHAPPSRDLLERGLVDDTTAFLSCSQAGQPYVFDESADTDPHDCFCDAGRHALVDQPDVAQLVCGSCATPIEITPADGGGATYSCAADCPAENYTILAKSIYRSNAGVFL